MEKYVGDDAETLELSYGADESVKMIPLWKTVWQFSCKLNGTLTIWSNNLTSRCFHKKFESLRTHKDLFMNAHTSFTQNSPRLLSTQSGGWLNTLWLVFLYTGILHRVKMEQTYWCMQQNRSISKILYWEEEVSHKSTYYMIPFL